MALRVVQTPRDRLQRLLDYGVRARRYWWIVAAFVLLGGALSVGFALTQAQQFQSTAVLFYQERIQTSLLHGRDAVVLQRNIGERYRELLLARSQLAKIIEDPALNPFAAELRKHGIEAAVEELRLAIDFQIRGTNTFRIAYKDRDAERAQAVTAKLTELLIEKETELRLEQASATVEFARQQLEQATDELHRKERARAQFLVQHPIFAADEAAGQTGEGAAIRRRTGAGDEPRGPANPRLNALERQRARIRARLAAADGSAPVRTVERAPTATEVEARRRVDAAENEVTQRQREIEALRGRGLTDAHPDLRKARDLLAVAQSRLKRSEAELAALQAGAREPVAPPANPAERATLERELREVEQQIARERSRGGGRPEAPSGEDIADQVVQLETQWARLRREVAEQAERVQTLSDSVFRSQLDAQTRIAEQGTALQVVDPAFLPRKPIGKGKRMLVLAGLVVFTGLGLGLAVGLAIVDDRLYRRVDREQLAFAPVLAVIPPARRGWWRRASRR
jgi:uncharacterized protein involved in exopolysaccharide biosynthesis